MLNIKQSVVSLFLVTVLETSPLVSSAALPQDTTYFNTRAGPFSISSITSSFTSDATSQDNSAIKSLEGLVGGSFGTKSH
jgi:hypothetical protein